MPQLALSSTTDAERLTLGVLVSGVAALALSDFVSPLYWSLPVIAAFLRWWFGTHFSLTEMQASLIGWFGFLWVGFELIMGRAWVVAFTDFLLILALAVTIEIATPRNHLHRMLTGLFLMLAGAVLTDSVLYAIPLTALIWFTWRSAMCLYGLQQIGGDLPLHTPKHDLRSVFAMIIMALLIFIILPRFDVQSTLQPTQPRKETTGFSNYVQLGDFARELDSTVILRAESISDTDNMFRRHILGRYWRGVALSQYINHGWRQRSHRSVKRWHANQPIVFAEASPSRRAIAIFREASDHSYIFLPDGVANISEHSSQVRLDDLGELSFNKPPNHRLRLIMRLDHISLTPIFYPNNSYLSQQHPMPIESDTRATPRVLQLWVKALTATSNTPEQALQLLTQKLRSWTYDLYAPIDAKHPLESFLKNKRGHCELYATTLALAARELGIPSRIINGYYGGEWNDTGNFFILRQQHAHSWVEVWQHGQWHRIDPTPTSRWQLSGVKFPQLDAIWETIKLSWYRYILAFQDNDREKLLQSIGSWLKNMLPWIALSLMIVFSSIYLYKKVRPFSWLQQSQNRQQRIWDAWLKKHHIIRHPATPLRNISAPKGINPNAWEKLIILWEKQAYGASSTWTPQRLKRHLRALPSSRC